MNLIEIIELLGLKSSDLGFISEEQMVRLEKKLRAERALGVEISNEWIVSFSELLKNYSDELSLLMHPDLSQFRRMIATPQHFILFEKRNEFRLDLGENERFITFIEQEFGDEIRAYVRRCLEQNHYVALCSFLFQKYAMNEHLRDELIKLMNQKMVSAMEYIQLRTPNIAYKISYAFNPFFFRCFNELGSIHFENNVRELLNVVVNEKISERHEMRIIFSMSFFDSVSEELRGVLKKNKRIAAKSGVKEITDRQVRGAGGTTLGKIKQDNGNYWIVYVVVVLVIGGAKAFFRNKETPKPDINMDRSIQRYFEENNLISDSLDQIPTFTSPEKGNE